MSDIIDDANNTAELHLSIALSGLKPPAPIPHGPGYCLECGVALAKPFRWCSAPCRDNYAVRNDK